MKENCGWFKKGYDPRRHVLSKEECRKGYLVTTQMAKLPSRIKASVRKKIRNYYIARASGPRQSLFPV